MAELSVLPAGAGFDGGGDDFTGEGVTGCEVPPPTGAFETRSYLESFGRR